MTTLLQQAFEAAAKLSEAEQDLLASRWLAELDQRRWDEQFEQDVAAGRLDALAAEAGADYEAGRTREL